MSQSPSPETTPGRRNWLHQPLAVVGLACRLPGGDSLEQFWNLLLNGRQATGPLPETFFNRQLYYSSEKSVRGKSYSDVGGLIDARPLDWSIMPLAPTAADSWDPCHLILCEVAASALKAAGYDPRSLTERRAGVYIGHSGGSTAGGELAYRALVSDYVDLLEDVPQWQTLAPDVRAALRDELLARLRGSRPERRVGGKPYIDAGCAAGLLSHAFDLNGPHMSIDAACASSLVALALGAAALQAGQIDMAIVGGASINKFDSLILFSQAQSCSAGKSRPFDAAADGLISSEGYVVFVLKRLESALAAGDRIEAVIHGIGISSDGRGRSLWAPRKEGQLRAIERAYSDGVTADSVQMVEAHATSTQVGDATEMEALAAFFRNSLTHDQKIPVGSVKSNIGHTLETAGLAGLVKAILAIQHGVIPPSINVHELSKSIPWQDTPLEVVRQPIAWPALPASEPRRAAVNAFGIGGLNVHVIVDQFVPGQTYSSTTDSKRSVEPINTTRNNHRDANDAIAIVGRGLVVPGALNVKEFAELLQTRKLIGPASSSHSSENPLWPLCPPPKHRLRDLKFKQTAADRLDIVGGFITNYAYDWRKHKVPPKQIAQANPLQFMLLEAAEQALQEAGYLEKSWNRHRAAVVVGSAFGGEFGNSLYAGLRLPEFKHQLKQILLAQLQPDSAQVSQSARDSQLRAIDDLLATFEDTFLKNYPALLDETGSFTSSTLASRLSKTFDLMGGAMAIDAGDASSLAALDASINLLRSGAADHVLCAAGHSAMDRASLERLSLMGQLALREQVTTASPEERKRLATLIPAEGVALLLVRRLEDALADGDQVLATIGSLTANVDRDRMRVNRTPSLQHKSAIQPTSQPLPAASPSQAVVGNLYAAQGLVDVIEGSLATAPQNIVTQCAFTGLTYSVAVQQGTPIDKELSDHKPDDALPVDLTSPDSFRVAASQRSDKSFTSPAMPSPISRSESTNIIAVSETVQDVIASQIDSQIVRLSATDRGQLASKLHSLSQSSWSDILSRNPDSFESDEPSMGAAWRAALVVHAGDYHQKTALLARQIGELSAIVPLTEQGLFWSSPELRASAKGRGKTAWVFSGQGSQYPGMLREWVDRDLHAAQLLAKCNQALRSLGQPAFEELAWSQTSQLGENVWHTQAAMLVSDYLLMNRLMRLGYTPDVVAGHSFGEFAAMVAAGCWSFETALQATWHRCKSIMDHVRTTCMMLSIQASGDLVEQLIRTSQLKVSISHRNAPEQTVVGGTHAAITQFVQLLESRSIPSRLLAVPTAYHTPALSDAQAPFATSLQAIDIEPPRIPLLSSIDNRYAADPIAIRQQLVSQLVTPLDFVALVERLISSGVRVVVEVGPQQVLTRLVRQIAGNSLLVLSTDHPKRGTEQQLLCAQAGLEVMCGSAPRFDWGLQSSVASSSPVVTGKPRQVAAAESIHFDATLNRRQRMRSNAVAQPAMNAAEHISSGHTSVVQPALHFDASQTRRDRNRQQTPQVMLPAAAPIAAPTIAVAPIADLSVDTTAPVQAPVQSQAAIEAFLIDFVVEQTGYPAEIIELDWDIEADLGIDSIKKAQLFGELREFFDLESLQSFSLDSFASLRDISNLLATIPGKGDWLQRAACESKSAAEFTNHNWTTERPTGTSTESASIATVTDALPVPSTPAITPPVNTPIVSAPIVSAAQPSELVSQPAVAADAAKMQQFLIDFVVEQTGYPEEIVELDADLEADLGIDSIKKAQLFGELRELFAFPVPTGADNRFSLNEFRTLRSVLELLLSLEVNTNVPAQASELTHSELTHSELAHSELARSGSEQRVVEPVVRTMQPSFAASELTTTQPLVETPAFEFRSLVPLDEVVKNQASASASNSSFVDSSERPISRPTKQTTLLPIAIMEPTRVRVNRSYTDALFANLQSMAGRSHRTGEQLQVVYNGEKERVGQAVLRLGQATGAADVSLLALDACIAAQAYWKPAQTEDHSGPSATDASNDHHNSLHSIAQLIVPSWLRASGVPIAAHVHRGSASGQSTTLELLVPGSVTASLFVTARGLVLTGGSLVTNAHDPSTGVAHSAGTDLSTHAWLRGQSSGLNTLIEFERAARTRKTQNDWWMQCVDLRSQLRCLVESRNGVIVIEKGWLPTMARPTAAQCVAAAATAAHDAASVELAWDSEQQQLQLFACWTVALQAESPVAIPVTALETWSDFALDNTLAVVPNQMLESVADSKAEQIVSRENSDSVSQSASEHLPNTSEHSAEITDRYILRMVPSPQRPTKSRRPVWSGAALIIGDNPVATQLEARLRSAKVPVTRWSGSEEADSLARRFDELTQQQAVRHLFITTPCDKEAVSSLDRNQWQRRRNVGLMSLFWLCQRWHAHVLSSGWVDDTSLVAVTSLGGDFGIQGCVQSIEGGALTGLFKAILIESWVQGFRTFPIKVLDTSRHDSPAQVVDQIWQELAVPSFDLEVAYCGGERHVVRAIAKPVAATLSESGQPAAGARVTRGGTWVCTGGARGITAHIVEQLAKRYALKLHLLGTQPLPQIPPGWRNLDETSLRELKVQVMTSARAAGKNPVTTWQDTEKALEIDHNLRRFRELGFDVHYHTCDVSDRDQVAQVLTEVRKISGPIQGVLHGAGIGKDARFDRKQSEKVNQCIGAKIDGAWSLIEATWSDPLETFISFGSISGRFGANGHTDYSLANDMLCKQMDWLRSARPGVHAVGFHWHAWGDIGMATKPETRLALEMINMQFMPAAEGVAHLLRELDSGSRESEVLITDDRYYRLFYSPEALVDSAGRSLAHLPPATPLLDTPNTSASNSSQATATKSVRMHTATLNPGKDPFLTDHRLDDRPLLPIVVGSELLLEAARAHLGDARSLKLIDVQAIQGLRFYSDAPQSIRIKTELLGDGSIQASLLSDFHARDGRLVERDRLNLTSRIVTVDNANSHASSELTRVAFTQPVTWHRAQYPAVGSKFYVGLPLQRLRSFALSNEGLVGRITAPAMIELAGGLRQVRGWQLPSSAVDACLFATGILAWQQVAPGSALPTGFGEIKLGRMPYAGEACEVHVQLRGQGTWPQGQAAFNFTLYGVDGDALVNVRDYRVAWLMDAATSATTAIASKR